MEKLGRGPSLAALLAMLAITAATAHADSDIPPARSARLGLAIASLDDAWRESNAYRASGLMVVGVDPRGRAAKSGILAGDVLVSVGSRTMREPRDLGHAERALSPDKAVSVVLARDGGRMIKIFEIAPVGAMPAAAPGPPSAGPAAELSPAAAVTATAAPTDTAPPPVAVPTAALSDAALPPAEASDTASRPAAVATTTAASDTTPPPTAIPTTSAAADPATSPADSGASGSAPVLAASQSSTAADGAPSVTATGSPGTQAAVGGTASAPVALAAPAAIAAVPVAAVVIEPGTSPAPTAATADSGGTSPERVEPATVELGVVGKSLTPDLATALGASGVEGILVLEVAAASPADRSGLRAGDIIVRVGDQPVADMEELQRAAAGSSSPVSVSTLRLGKSKVELVALDGPPPVPIAPPSQEQLLMDLRDEVRSLRREVQNLRKKLGK